MHKQTFYSILCLFAGLFLISAAETQKPKLHYYYGVEGKSTDYIKFLEQQAQLHQLELSVDSFTDQPIGIAYTPALIFKNDQFTNFYNGPQLAEERTKLFIKLSKMAPQARSTELENAYVLSNQSLDTYLPIKVTEVGGQSNQLSVKQIKEWIDETLKSNKVQFKKKAQKSILDRYAYFDFHPYLAEDGTLCISTELYSQYNCKKPVFTTLKSPVKGKEHKKVVEEAVKQLLNAHQEKLINSKDQYAVYPVVAAQDVKAGAKKKQLDKDSNQQVPTGDYTIEIKDNALNPPVLFHFPAPLDRYFGEIQTLKGSFSVDQSGFSKADFTVDMKTLTTGDEFLDDYVLGEMLNVATNTSASFKGKEFNGNQVKGELSFMNTESDITVDFDYSDNQVSAQFLFPMLPFSLEGPEGPEEAQNFIQFYSQFSINN